MTDETSPTPASRRQKILVTVLLALVLLLAAFLRFYHLGESGVGNQYYAAAVKSMLQSWHNFFFVAFEPGGSVSVDKPPLGFWVQCLSAYFLGVNGFALALPNALAGVFSVFIVYKLVRRPFGPWAGLAAALALSLTPVAVSAERNNTIDGLLVFVLLLAAWAVLQAVYTRRVGWLFVGMFLVGLGFNIKMLQAYLILPGLYALYFFAAKFKWWKKILHLAASTLLLLVVSFSWAVIVDLTPPENRPYVGGSENNTVMELIFGHNGLSRLIGGGLNRVRADAPRQPVQNPPYVPQPGQNPGLQPQPYGQPPVQNLPPGNVTPPAPLPYGQQPPQNPGVQPLPYAQPPAGPYPRPPLPGGQIPPGQGGNMDVGAPGTLRLFTFPLVGEIGWTLPFVLAGIVIVIAALWKQPLDEKHAALFLWAGWLLPEALYFTYSTGIMHAYYMIMMGAPLAAIFAMTGWALWQWFQKRKWLALGLLALLAGGTILFQAMTMCGRTSAALWTTVLALLLLAAAAQTGVRLAAIGLSLALTAVLLAPGLWSLLTTFNSAPNVALPYSGPAQTDGQPVRQIGRSGEVGVNQPLLAYLLENYRGEKYLLATLNANQAAPFILTTGLPVFTFGGFGGMDVIADANGLAEMVAAGELRFVLSQGLEQRQDIFNWLQQNCVPVDLPGQPSDQTILVDCGK